ncbi:MAG: nitroreductase [Cellvibrionales bacterium TMED21]|jgi:nitroreductase|nr:nitroreductase [Halieaceae bacterium]OUT64869.1 MAG: nitroreductase [Cellvibrionales bacterium TMED21]|tara:strand:+ start:2649 stop:3317 length:669 start_codon:yes stop_codon:yes gene_type:complete
MERAEVFDGIVRERRSIRAFTAEKVSRETIEEVFGAALRAPSNCNTQPWFVHVVTGEKLEQLREMLPQAFMAGDVAPDFPYDGVYEGVYKDRQYGAARALYDALGIPREEKAKRQEWFLGNFRFFDAPAVAFFMLPDGFGLREACDLGMFAQSVMLGLTARGLGSCPQTALGFMAKQVRAVLEIPSDHKLMFGLSFGVPIDTPINDVVTDRMTTSEALTFHD